jgi:HK97 family phage portal protein
MGFLRGLREQRGYNINDPKIIPLLSRYVGSSTGFDYNDETAMRAVTVFSCIRVIAETVASLPLILYKRNEDGRERAESHPLYKILHNQPNPEMTSQQFRELMTGWLAARGNAYANIQWTSRGEVEALWPIPPDRIYPARTTDSNKLYYRVWTADGKEYQLLPEQVFHIVGFGWNGMVGASPVRLFAETIGLYLAREKYDATYYANDATPSFVLTHPEVMTEDGYKRLKESFASANTGLDKKHRFELLEEGVKVEQLSISHADSQFIEGVGLDIEKIASIWRVPLHMVQHMEKSTAWGTGIEHLSMGFIRFTIQPYLSKWEETITKDLMRGSDRDLYYSEHLQDAMLRGDTKTRYEAYKMGREAGFLSVNKILRAENMEPVPVEEGGDELIVPLNYQPLKKLLAPDEEQPPEEQQFTRNIQTRAKWSESEKRDRARRKMAVARSFKGVLEEAMNRSTKKEIADLRKILKRDVTPGEILGAVDEYYEGHKQALMKGITPAVYAICEATQAIAASEVGHPTGLTPGLRECIDEHILHTARWNADVSKRKLIKTLEQRSLDKEVMEDAEEVFAVWAATKGKSFAEWEATRNSGMMSKATYYFADIPGSQWITLDGNQFCIELDMEVVEIGIECRDTFFAEKGEILEKFRRSDEFTPAWNVATPPLWNGCYCQILPAF